MIRFERPDDLGRLILRLALGLLMLGHGAKKLVKGYAGIGTMLTEHGLPAFIAHGVILGEVVAPLLLIVGYATRVAGALIAFTMAMSMYLAMGWSSFSLNEHWGLKSELNLLYLLGSVAVCFLGSGKYAISRGKGRLD